MIYIDGVTNVRDIGGMVNKDGLMVRQGLYYRSGEFNDYNNITDLGIRQIMDLGIVCEIDLRYDYESAHAVLPSSVKYFRPYNSSGEGGLAPYQYGLRNYADQYRDVFKVMADSSNFPMVCHCIAGADRTGTVTALLEALLGCTELEMAVDYQWTSLSVWGIRDTAGYDWKGLMSEIKSYDKKNGTVQAGAWYYLLSKGLSVSGLKSIRKIFLNDTVQPYPDTPDAIDGKKITVNYTTRAKCFLYDNRCFTVGPETRRIDVFDLSGKRIWKFERPFTGNELKIQLPRYARGVFVMYCVNEKTN
jgi:protein-tyrosine phosphatase